MNLNKLVWALIFTALVGICGWNIMENRVLHHQLLSGTGAGDTDGLVANLLQNRHYELAQAGKILVWPESLELLGEGSLSREGPRLVLAIDEISCNSCREAETQFALTLAGAMDFLHIVVRADNQRYVRSYMRLNGIDRPVYFDRESAFFRANQLGSTPILLVLNERGEAIAAHAPIPGHEGTSEPFHQFCYRFFGIQEPSRP